MSNEREQILALAKEKGLLAYQPQVFMLEAFYHAAIQQYKDSILADVEEPAGWFKYDEVSKCWHPQYEQYVDRYAAEQNWQRLYTTDQLIAARKPLEEEIERLKQQSANRLIGLCEAGEDIDELRKQLAESQARGAKLNSVLCEIAASKSLTATPTQFYQHLQRVASNATFESFVATALNELIAKAGEVMRKRCEVATANYIPWPHKAIRALPGVTLEDLNHD